MSLYRILPALVLVAAPGSMAFGADLPVKAKAVEYVKVCSAYGAGYYYVPGTDTCLRVGGYARADVYVNAVGTFNPAISSVSGTTFRAPGGAGIGGFPFVTANSPDYLTRARAIIDLDARTATDCGVLRSFLRVGGNWDSQASAGSPAGGSFYLERAFIQFAGFTFGYTQSFFDTGISYMMTTPYAGSNTWTTAVAYTAQFGNGFSATVSLEDANYRTTGVQAANPTFTATGVSYVNWQDGTSTPDIVANLRLDQTWGTAMISGALHQVGAITPTPYVSYLGESSTDSWGWAIGGSLEIKLPMLAPGDSLYIQANYADGALNYLGLSGNYQNRSTGLGSISVGTFANALSGAYYPIADAIWTGTGYAKESGWAIQGQFRHFWTPGLRSAVYVGYVDVDVPATTLNAESVNLLQVGLNTIWSPVRNLDLGLEVLYNKIDGGSPLLYAGGSAVAVPVAIIGGSTDVWSGGFRAQRNF